MRGRPSGQTPVNWVAKFEEQQKAIMLCNGCDRWFNPKAHHYVRWSYFYATPGRCDRCNGFDFHRKTFIHESFETRVAVQDGPRRRSVIRATAEGRGRKTP